MKSMLNYRNALTIDVEDYWSVISRDWCRIADAQPTEAVVRNTEWFLETLGCYQTKASFFILGEVAQAFPALIRQINAQGHEIGVHGFFHKQIFKLTPEQFRQEVQDCKKLLEDVISAPVIGHRAPAFSINPQTQWALDILAQVGFEYDSSVFPILGRRYGWPGFSKEICRVHTAEGRSIIEVPMTVWSVFGKTLPAAGGGYLRHFPYLINRHIIKQTQKQRPVIVYMHPYEIDDNPPTLNLDNLTEFEKNKAVRFHKVQCRNRHTIKDKLVRLLSDFQFTTLKDIINQSEKPASINL